MDAKRKRSASSRALSIEATVREFISKNPDFVLNDAEMMRALLSCGQKEGRNVVDLRGAVISRLEERLGRLAEAHRDMIEAAWDNITGMEQVHRAALEAIDAQTFERFCEIVTEDFTELLNVDWVRFCLSSAHELAVGDSAFVILSVEQMAALMARHRTPGQPQRVLLHGHLGSDAGLGTSIADPAIYGADAPLVGSEAVIRLDFGRHLPPGLLVFGAQDPERFHEEQGSELLSFLGAILERAMRGWLSLTPAL
ncbi:MAG: DUF484 family protein [Neomegalonema sp.]|nr:DUF484 family protein [Neomegalonema sp.]